MEPLTIKIYEGPASSDFTTTLMAEMSRDIEKEQLYIASNQAYSELQRRLAQKKLPCRLLGRQQLPLWVAEKAGLEDLGIVDEHVRIRLLEDILRDLGPSLHFLSLSDNPATAARDLGTLIARLQKAGVKPADLEEILETKTFSAAATEAKFRDLTLVMSRYLERLSSHGQMTREDSVLATARLLEERQIPAGNVCIDVLDDYDTITRELLKALILNADSVSIARPRMPEGRDSRGNAHYKRAGSFYRDLIRDIQKESDRPVTVRYETAQPAARAPGLEALSRSLEDPTIPPADLSDALRLQAAATLEDELMLASWAVKELILSGESPSSILVTGAGIGSWHEAFSALLSDEGVDSVYYQGDTLSRSSVYGFFSSLLAWLQDPGSSSSLLRLLQHPGLGLSGDDRSFLVSSIPEQGPEYELGLQGMETAALYLAQQKGHEKEAAQLQEKAQTIRLALLALCKLTDPLKTSMEQARTVAECCQELLAFAEGSPFLSSLQESYEQMQETNVSGAEKLAQEWITFNRMILQLEQIFGDRKAGMSEFRKLIDQFADELIVTTAGSRRNSVQLEPLHSSRTIHCRHLFLLGAENSEIPVVPNPAFLSDQEIEVLKAALIDFRGNREWADESVTDAVTAIANTSDSVYISWHVQDGDQKLEPAQFLLPVIRKLEPEAGENITPSQDTFQKDLIELQKQAGQSGFESAARRLRYQYRYSQRYSRLLRQAVLWMTADSQLIDSQAAARIMEDCQSLSVTALESYSQCPFRFFMQRGLKAREPGQFREQAMDAGNLLHSLLETCVRAFADQRVNLHDRKSVGSLFEKTFEDLARTHNRRILETGGLMNYEKQRLKEQARLSLDLVVDQLENTLFRPSSLEQKIGMDGSFTVPLPSGESFPLRGVIDRVDSWIGPDDTQYVRVIDYKTGTAKKKVTAASIGSGTLLQPPLYLSALLDKSQVQAAGMYYDVTRPEIRSLEPGDSPLDPGCRDGRRLTGATLNNEAVLCATEPEYESSPESYTFRNIQASTTKDGSFNMRTSRDTVVSEEQMRLLIDLAVKKSGEIIDNIRNGQFRAQPDKDSTPCTHCPYRVSCGRVRTAIQ